jgi:hypothetical protein
LHNSNLREKEPPSDNLITNNKHYTNTFVQTTQPPSALSPYQTKQKKHPSRLILIKGEDVKKFVYLCIHKKRRPVLEVLYNDSLHINYNLKASSLSHFLGLKGTISTILIPWGDGSSSPWGIFSCQTNSFSFSNFLSVFATISISFLKTAFHESSPGVLFFELISASQRTPTETPTWPSFLKPSARCFLLRNSCSALQDDINS